MTCTIHHGDCLTWLHTLDAESVDLVVTDPAYESLEKQPQLVPSRLDRCMRGQVPVISAGAVRVPLFGGRSTVIDLEDYQIVETRLWSANVYGYAQTTRGELLHISIMGRRDGLVVDHINRDRLDNRRSNLRLCTRAENVVNAAKPKTNTSGFKGVTWDSIRGKWKAQVYYRGKNVFLGRFDSATDAAIAYDKWASELHGSFLATNRSIGAFGCAP